MRSEQKIFDELATLCSSPGYVHAIAYFCFRDNKMGYSGEMRAEDMRHLFSKSRLIRTEISTLIGLLLKSDIDYSVAPPDLLKLYVDRTETLLDEIHSSMSALFFANFDPHKIGEKQPNPFTSGAVLREPIFYSGESAYSFQYRDLAPRKYANDDGWLVANRGYSIQAARDVIFSVGRLLDEKAPATLNKMREKPPEEWTLLPIHTFIGREVADYARIDFATVNQVLTSFAVPDEETNSLRRSMISTLRMRPL
jgi:hypothetical protein